VRGSRARIASREPNTDTLAELEHELELAHASRSDSLDALARRGELAGEHVARARGERGARAEGGHEQALAQRAAADGEIAQASVALDVHESAPQRGRVDGTIVFLRGVAAQHEAERALRVAIDPLYAVRERTAPRLAQHDVADLDGARGGGRDGDGLAVTHGCAHAVSVRSEPEAEPIGEKAARDVAECASHQRGVLVDPSVPVGTS